MGDIVSDHALTVGSGTLGVDNALGDTLAGEVGELVNKVEVGEDDGALCMACTIFFSLNF